MKQFGESTAKKLTLDSVPVESIFHFEGENYKEKQKVYIAILYKVRLQLQFLLRFSLRFSSDGCERVDDVCSDECTQSNDNSSTCSHASEVGNRTKRAYSLLPAILTSYTSRSRGQNELVALAIVCMYL
jgi:hypothetical protein